MTYPMTEQEKRNLARVEEILRDFSEWEIAEAWNRYCESTNRYDDMVHHMDELNEEVYGMDAIKIIETFCNSDFNVNDDWFWYDGLGYACSGSVWDIVDIEELAEYALDYEEDYGCAEIRDILMEDDEESEESDE